MSSAIYDAGDPSFGVDPDSGQPFTNSNAVSPAQGCVPSALTGDANASGASPASVLGTGQNPDLIVYHAEAV